MEDLEDDYHYDDDYGYYDRTEPRQIFCDSLLMPNSVPFHFGQTAFDAYPDSDGAPLAHTPRHIRAVYAREPLKDGGTLICVDFTTSK